ncbi:hypothetical protein BDR04DRAFT_817643 [Suillus decipiens]|nr:hypothetical protein BDR04DRAFT_817643 [Suillus decipiens]
MTRPQPRIIVPPLVPLSYKRLPRLFHQFTPTSPTALPAPSPESHAPIISARGVRRDHGNVGLEYGVIIYVLFSVVPLFPQSVISN